MKVIWKFLTNASHEKIMAKEGGIVRKVSLAQGFIRLWIEVDKDANDAPFRVTIVGTGQKVPEDMTYIDTVFEPPFVWHIYVKELTD